MPWMRALPLCLVQDWQPEAKRALLIGCNYASDDAAELKGCALDVHCFARMLLTRFG